MRLFFALSLMIFLAPQQLFAAGADLGFRNKSDLFFSTDTFIIGDTIRVYATVHNFGDVDVAGYVSFMQGMVEIGNTQVISVRAGGQQEEVYVDFVVPEGAFNIRAEIRGTDPADTNTANDVILSPLETPIADEDGDGVVDESDNCPSTSNPDQKDSDADGDGDRCDSDDDNDTLSDDVEAEMGLNPISSDSDGDGVNDANDYAPADATVTVMPVAAPVVVAAPVAPETTTPSSSATSAAATQEEVTTTESVAETSATSENAVSDDTEETSNGAALSDLQISPNAIFSYEQTGWNTYTFAVRGFADDGYRYDWDFGDGVRSNRAEITHTYRTFGDYTITLTVTDDAGAKSTDSTSLNISFFHSQNPYLQILLVFLGVLCVTSVGLYLRVTKPSV